MAQLTLYMNDALVGGLRSEAKEEGVSLSKYVSGILDRRHESRGWPPGYLDLYGSIDDETFVEPPDEVPSSAFDDLADWFME